MQDQSQYFRRPAAAEYLKVSERTISAWQRARVISFSKIGRKIVLFKRADLDKAMEKFVVKAVQGAA